jgi:hypothetical protein
MYANLGELGRKLIIRESLPETKLLTGMAFL